LAQLVEREAIGYGVFARVGREAFIFLLRSADFDAAVVLANRLRIAVATLPNSTL